MAFNLNRVCIAGNLTRDPQLKMLPGDRAVAEFGVAINHKYKAADGTPKEETTFVDIEAWGRTAELCGQYLTKGRPVYLEGRLKFEKWQTQDGEKRQKLKVTAESVQFLGPAPSRDSAAPTTAGAPAVPAAASATDDEPPF